ncbi:amidase family protein [Heterostelium album PN500]|uniref:Amidase family protein n=1 Tax=Heterostelium pallidum (strain ATCC 26659 / Pp 5 / PN500) TaxID=670386 RepID=D3B2R6_HETP5|nr:amidase family protein [Heterostelium album PN500]EFA83614.1 amidase family protein [Heterostelium album PN500]|eukprot:XP_020435731.1 amidase family protein [Heterostelium album PN500]
MEENNQASSSSSTTSHNNNSEHLKKGKYDLVKIVTPRIYGSTLKVGVFMAESSLFKNMFIGTMMKKNGFTELFAHKLSLPVTPFPHELLMDIAKPYEYKTYGAQEFLKDVEGIKESMKHIANQANTTLGFYRAFQEGKTDPVAVASTFLLVQKQSDEMKPPLGAFIAVNDDDVLEQARASQQRWKQGTPLSILDGVPVSIKDEVDQRGYKTTCGTSFLGKINGAAQADAYPVDKLRENGALLVGKANMHEIGISTLGYNLHHGFIRNPFNLDHYPGGSSSGSASSVSAGLNPISIGCDGGGSVRVPASLCGVVGMKPTFGRVSHTGTFDLCSTVGHIGPLSSTVVDNAIAYAVIAGRDPLDFQTMIQPEPIIPVFQDIPLNKPLQGIRVGVFKEWCNDCTPDIQAAFKKSLTVLEEQGATFVDYSISDLLHIRLSQIVLILSEMRNSMSRFWDKHRTDLHNDTRVSLSLMDGITSSDYLHCNRFRTHAIEQLKEIFQSVDVIVTPTNATLAPKIMPYVLSNGESNMSDIAELMKFAFLGNITGVPGLSIPISVNEENLPIGIQLMGRWWEEDLLYYTGYVLEREFKFNGVPKFFKPILENQISTN